MKQKCEILNLIQSGQSIRLITEKYSVGKSTVTDINFYLHKSKLLEYVAFSDSGSGR